MIERELHGRKKLSDRLGDDGWLLTATIVGVAEDVIWVAKLPYRFAKGGLRIAQKLASKLNHNRTKTS